MIDTLIRWRTWLFNTATIVLFSGAELLISLDSALNWRDLLPPEYVPFVILSVALVNIWMRPRPAVRAKDVAE